MGSWFRQGFTIWDNEVTISQDGGIAGITEYREGVVVSRRISCTILLVGMEIEHIV